VNHQAQASRGNSAFASTRQGGNGTPSSMRAAHAIDPWRRAEPPLAILPYVLHPLVARAVPIAATTARPRVRNARRLRHAPGEPRALATLAASASRDDSLWRVTPKTRECQSRRREPAAVQVRKPSPTTNRLAITTPAVRRAIQHPAPLPGIDSALRWIRASPARPPRCQNQRWDERHQAVANGEQTVTFESIADCHVALPYANGEPARILTSAMKIEAITSPLTNFIAPSMAP